jgi:hypothetical protein
MSPREFSSPPVKYYLQPDQPLTACKNNALQLPPNLYNGFINSEKKGITMFSYIDTIQNLPVAQKRSLVKSIKEMIKEDIIANRQANFERKQNSALLRATKKAERIAKLEAKLNALRNPVGAKAIKAAKKPGKVTTTKFA